MIKAREKKRLAEAAAKSAHLAMIKQININKAKALKLAS